MTSMSVIPQVIRSDDDDGWVLVLVVVVWVEDADKH